MNSLKYTNKLFLLISFSIFTYIVFLLISNISSGFDITDNSFYILHAQHQTDVYQVLRRDGYYTGILYFLANGNLSYHRLFGILLLIGLATWFTIELYKYISKSFSYRMTIMEKLFFIIPIILGALTYYKSWLLTPSYNWLTLISILLVFIALFRIVTNKENNYLRFFTFDYFILSFALNLAFMAKPTTAIILALIILLFSIFERSNINIKKAFLSIFMVTVLITLGHIILLEGSLISYYQRVVESLERMSTLDSRYTLTDRLFVTFTLLQESFLRISYLLSFIAALVILYYKKTLFSIHTVLIYFIFLVYAFFLFKFGIDDNFRLLWLKTTDLLFLSILLFLIAIAITNQKEINFQTSKRIILLVLIFISACLSYSFGTNNNIIHAMSTSLVFVIVGILIIHYFLDKTFSTNIFLPTASLTLSLYVLFTLHHAYEHPYRLITNIKEQNQKVELLGGLYVDKINKKYIEDLQSIAKINKPKEGKITLLDMTGGSPGANVILNAKFFGEPWLAGAYPGSNKVLERVLNSYQDTDKLKKSWILVAPEGRRKLDLNILNKIGLDFPKSYIKIGTVQTAHRNELQELWKPISTLK